MGKKGDFRKNQIIESASYCLAHFGERGTTFQAIAARANVSEALVVRYLQSRDEILPAVLAHWIADARTKTEMALLKGGTAEEKLRNYFDISIEIFVKDSIISKIYLMLHYFAGIDERYRVFNTEVKEVAVARIIAILEQGMTEGVFAKTDVRAAAKTIHNSLVGYVLSSITEINRPADLKLPDRLTEHVLKSLR